jgi:hypothetical protein
MYWIYSKHIDANFTEHASTNCGVSTLHCETILAHGGIVLQTFVQSGQGMAGKL